MRHYNKGTERQPLVDYKAFVNGLRLPLEGTRMAVVKEAFCKINCEPDATCFTVAQAKEAFSYDEFDKWCQAIEVPENDIEVVTWDMFSDFYADISMAMFDDQKFVELVAASWTVTDAEKFNVCQKDIETLVGAIRHNLMKYGSARHTEEFVLRELFREFDTARSGLMTLADLKNILFKINLASHDAIMQAMISKFECSTGAVNFEEFCSYIISDPYHRV